MKNRLKFLLYTAFFGLVLSASIPLASKVEFKVASAADPVINPISEYHFNSGNVGADAKGNYNLSTVGGPTGTGSTTTAGIVTFDGSDDFIASNGTSTASNNIFFDYSSSNLTIAFDLTVKSFSTGWMFPITFYDGGDIWAFSKSHVGFLIDPDGHRLRYADTTGTTGLTDWWYPDLCSLTANETITIVVSINKGGNTNIYINGSASPSYSKASYNGYSVTGSDWSGFCLGAFSWRDGSHVMKTSGYGFTNCTFKNLKIYNFAFTSSQAVSWSTDTDRNIYKTTYSINYETNGGTINSGRIDSYIVGEQYYLPTDVTKAGSVFGGWYDNSLFNGNPITVITTSDEGNKALYAKWTVATTGDGELTPNYYYRFTNSSNPGQESNSQASLTKTGNVTISDGSAVFDGTGALYGTSQSGSKNFSETLDNFTFGFDLTVTATSSNWQFPFSFGFNDNAWLNMQIAPDSTKLMLSCSGAKQGSQTNAYWGHTVINSMNLYQKYRMTISFTIGGNVLVYVNGALALSTPVDSSFSVKGQGFSFTLGGNYDVTYNTFQNGLIGKIAHFDVYTFAANNKECVQDGAYNKIYYDEYNITLITNEGTYRSGYSAPTKYRTRVGASLPSSTEITRSGYTFKGWYASSTFDGSAVVQIGGSSTGNKTYYAKWIDSSVSTDPIAKYEFKNSSNPGQDTMGNYQLTNVGASVSSGTLNVTGSAALYGYGNAQNFMNDYGSFTLSFDMNMHDLGSSEWKIPFSFGDNGTQNGCLNFNPSNPHVLRFKLRDGSTYIAGSGTDMFWGSELTYIPEWTWVNVTISVKEATSTVAGKITIFVDGMTVFSKSLPKGFHMPVNYLAFGGYYNGSSVSNGVNGAFRNIRVYNFNATEDQVNYYLNNGYDLPSSNTIAINYNVGEHGYISAPRLALINETITINTYPSEDYIVDKAIANGEVVSATSTNVYKVKVANPTSISVTFIKNIFSLTSTEYGSGTVTFLQNNVPVTKINKGTSVTIVVTPDSGYQTIGFKVNNETCILNEGTYTINNVTEDIHVTASFEEIKPTHTVSFVKNGGSWTDPSMENEIEFTEGIGCSLPGGVDITKVGYTFSGWYLDEECELNPISSIDETVTNDLVLYAKWTPVDYNITYSRLDGATIVGEYPTGYTYGVGATLPTNVSKTGYTFLGWYDNYACSGDPITEISSTDIGNKIFYAKLEKNTYTISFITNGGSFESGYTAPASYLYGEQTILPSANDISKAGYTFAGWYLNSQFEGDSVDTISIEDYGNKTFYAKWENATYEIIYVLGEGAEFTEDIDIEYTYGSTHALPTSSKIHKEGYTFAGWYTDPNFDSDVVLEIGETEYGAKTYYAKYVANTYNVYYKETDGADFAGTHEDVYVTQYTFDQTSVLDVPTRPGYEFEGYYLTDTCTPSSRVWTLEKGQYTDDIILYVNWTDAAVDYSIYYYLNGGEWTSNTYPTGYTSGEEKTLPNSSYLSKTGYEFLGWYNNPSFDGDSISSISVSETEDKTYYAKWNILTYTISYYDGSSEIHPTGARADYQVGTQYKLPIVSKSGYNFVGWYSDAQLENEVTYLTADDYGNKAYYAKFVEEVTTYNIIFDSNKGDGVSVIVSVDYGAEVNLGNYIYSKDNYTQVRWVDGDNNTYSLDTYENLANKGETIILYAIYEANNFEIDYVLNGGEISGSYVDDYTYGVEVNLPSTLSKDGYIFEGWYLVSTLDGERVEKIVAGSTGNVTVYAKWRENSAISTYSVTLNVGGGRIVSGNVYYYVAGETTALPTDMFYYGYRFAGWYLDENYTSDVVKMIEASDTGDKVFYAKWDVDNFSIDVAQKDGGVVRVPASTAKYGSQVSVTPAASYGYEVNAVYVNGVALEKDATGNYSFLLSGDSYVDVEFTKITFLVNVSAGTKVKNNEDEEDYEDEDYDDYEDDEDEIDYTEYLEWESDTVVYGDIFEMTIYTSKNLRVKSIVINGEDVTYLLVDNLIRYRANKINEDELDSDRKQLSVEVTFETGPEKNENGCAGSISSSIYLIVPIAIGLVVLIIFQRKEYYKKHQSKR